MKKFLFLILFFYLLTLFQASFLIHFSPVVIFPNLILIFQVLLTLFEDPPKNLTLFSAPVAGFFWDIFSENPIGLGILILILISLFLKIILRQYVRLPLNRF